MDLLLMLEGFTNSILSSEYFDLSQSCFVQWTTVVWCLFGFACGSLSVRWFVCWRVDCLLASNFVFVWKKKNEKDGRGYKKERKRKERENWMSKENRTVAPPPDARINEKRAGRVYVWINHWWECELLLGWLMDVWKLDKTWIEKKERKLER